MQKVDILPLYYQIIDDIVTNDESGKYFEKLLNDYVQSGKYSKEDIDRYKLL